MYLSKVQMAMFAIGVGVVWLTVSLVYAALGVPNSLEKGSGKVTAAVAPTVTATPTGTLVPTATRTVTPTSTSLPTKTAAPTFTPAPTPQPIIPVAPPLKKNPHGPR